MILGEIYGALEYDEERAEERRAQMYIPGRPAILQPIKLKNECDNFKNADEKEQSMKYQGKTIQKQKNANSWFTRYRHDGKQHFISGKTQAEVLKKLKEALAECKQKSITLMQWYNQWLVNFKKGKVKNITIRDYENSLNHLPEEIKNKEITKITALEMNAIINGITKERASQKLYELLTALFRKAKAYDIVEKNIMEIIEKPKHVRQEGVALSSKEQEVFITACKNNKYGDMYLVALYQGLRIGEILALTGNDIDLDNNKIIVNKSMNKENKVDSTKNKQSERTIPLFDKTRAILEKYSKFGNKRIFNLTNSVPNKHLYKLCESEGIRKISVHDLRHTFITNSINRGVPEHIVQALVGHKIGSSVTKRIYTHINNDDITPFFELLNK